MNEDVATIQRKCHAASLKSSDDTVPPKKRLSTKKYDPIDTPGWTKLTTFVTPAQTNQSIPTSVTKSPHDTPTTVGTSKSSVSFKSLEPTFYSPPALNQNASSTGSNESVCCIHQETICLQCWYIVEGYVMVVSSNSTSVMR